MRKARRSLLAGAAAALLLAVPTMIPAATASGAAPAASKIVDVPVSFQVENKNRTSVVCGSPMQPDGETYTIRGHLTGPADRIAAGDAATLYLHAVTQGEFYWRFDGKNGGVQGMDFTRQQAERGHVSVSIDRLGYGSSDKPPGLNSCFGSQADTANQVAEALKSGEYQIDKGEAQSFEKVFATGHSAGGLTGTIMAYSFDTLDGFINFGWADQTTSDFAASEVLKTNQRCVTKVAEDNKPFYTPFGTDKDRILFHSATKEVRAAVPDPQPDPCGDLLSFQDGIAANIPGVAMTTIPVLIVGAEKDSLFPPPALEFQAMRYMSSSDVTFEEIANTGHGFLYEATHPQIVDLVDEWLAARGG